MPIALGALGGFAGSLGGVFMYELFGWLGAIGWLGGEIALLVWLLRDMARH